MGTWGYESCSNDHVWDAMPKNLVADIHNIKSADARACLDAWEKRANESSWDWMDREVFVGLVVWALRYGCTVSQRWLKMAKSFIERFQEDQLYQETFKDAQKKRDALVEEQADIHYALEHQGCLAAKKKVVGLMERIRLQGAYEMPRNPQAEHELHAVKWPGSRAYGMPVEGQAAPPSN